MFFVYFLYYFLVHSWFILSFFRRAAESSPYKNLFSPLSPPPIYFIPVIGITTDAAEYYLQLLLILHKMYEPFFKELINKCILTTPAARRQK